MSFTFCMPMDWRIAAGVGGIVLASLFYVSAGRHCSPKIRTTYQTIALIWLVIEILFLIVNLKRRFLAR